MILKGATGPATLVLDRNGDVQGNTDLFWGYKTSHDHDGRYGGVWVEWRFKNDHLHLSNDRFGIAPFYYYATRDKFAVSTSIVDLLRSGAPDELDDAAIAVFLRCGYYVGDDTPFKHIRSLPPLTNIRWHGGKLEIESRPYVPKSGARTGISRREAIIEYGEKFDRAIRRYIPNGDVCLPLSGGRDSRHILFALLSNGCEPESCVTIGNRSAGPLSGDVAVASLLAQNLGLRHAIIPASETVQKEIEKNALTNFCADEHGWILPLRDHLSQRPDSLVFDGIAGDVFSSGFYMDIENIRLYRSRDFSMLSERLLGSEGYLPDLLKQDAYNRWNRKLAIDRFSRELTKYVDTPNPITHFFFWNRARREIALSPWSIIAHPCHVVAPYLDNQVFDFLASIPQEFLCSEDDFHTEAIQSRYPQYSHIPYAKKKTSGKRTAWVKRLHETLHICRYLFASEYSNGVTKHFSFPLPRLIAGLSPLGPAISPSGLLNQQIYLEQLSRMRLRGAKSGAYEQPIRISAT